MFGLGMQEMLIVGIVAVLLFGRKLPEVARSMGTSYREFRKGLNDIQSQVDINDHNYSPNNYQDNYHSYDDDMDEATAPKFDPPPAEPKSEAEAEASSDSSDSTGTA